MTMGGASSPVGRGLQAPLFEQLIQTLDPKRRLVVLDCGAARSGMINLLSAFRCRLVVLDLIAALPLPEELATPQQRHAVWDGYFAASDDEPGHLALSWNLFNYLKPDDIAALSALLALRLVPGARLHALIEYASPLMPARPGHWVPGESARLYADQPEIEQIPAPRYSLKLLGRLMPHFRPERSVLLSNGLQEHVFVRVADHDGVQH